MTRALSDDPEALRHELEEALANSAGTKAREIRVANNTAPSRSLDVASCTLAQLTAVVATLVQDVQDSE